MAFDKTRFRFRKDGDLRLVSHHDLMRALERMLRRAGLPFRSTEGFHPQPRMVFALSLPLGIVGLAEVVEIEWTDSIEPVDALAIFNEKAPTGLSFLSARRIELKQSARPRRARYRLEVPPSDIPDLVKRCSVTLAQSELWVDRERPRPRQVNIRPYLKDLRCTTTHLEMDLWITQDGSARADEMVRLLELSYLLEQGAVLERSELELGDELDSAMQESGPVLPRVEDRSRYEREKAKLKLQLLRTEMLAGTFDFATAARKHSQCPTASKGGDMGFISRKFQNVEEAYARTAFAMRVGEISDVVETELGMHLIKVTERKNGSSSKFEQCIEDVRDSYAEELRIALLNQLRKRAKIEISLP